MASPRPEEHHPAACGGVGVSAAAARLVYPTISTETAISLALAGHCKTCLDQPVRGVRRYLRDVVVTKKSSALFDSPGRPKGAVIREFSHQSRYRLLHTAKNCGVRFYSMATITYPRDFPRDGRLVKADLKKINQWFRDNFEGVRGIWFLEFQRRGAPHFHILLDIDLASYGPLVERRRRKLSKGAETYRTCLEMERGLAAAWFRIVGSGDERHLRAGVSWEVLEQEDAAIRYAAKHAAKPRQKEVPEQYENVGRFWGVIGGVKAEAFDEEIESMSTEQLLQEFGHEAISSKGRIKKYLWDVRNG